MAADAHRLPDGGAGEPAELYKVGLRLGALPDERRRPADRLAAARQAEVAIEALDAGATGATSAFYEGKVAVASFFAKNVLPLLTARADDRHLDNDIMELDEAAF